MATTPAWSEHGSDDVMSAMVSFAALCAAPALTFYALDRALVWWATHESPAGLGAVHPLQRDHPALERLVADLRRLEQESARVEGSDAPAKAHRLRVLALAYDDVLAECCQALQLPPPRTRPMSSWDRMQTQLELARHGLSW